MLHAFTALELVALANAVISEIWSSCVTKPLLSDGSKPFHKWLPQRLAEGTAEVAVILGAYVHTITLRGTYLYHMHLVWLARLPDYRRLWEECIAAYNK
jgi:formate hydrogenlyase subunit 3/multisubunit Na+/H+ antiporter MnhD subunit